MKRFLWILTIAASVITGLLLLSSVLAANDAPQPLASRPASAQAECDCSHLKALQIELRNALHLQQAFQGKITDLRKLDRAPASAEFQNFAAAAAKGVTRPAGDTGPEAVEYTPYGDSVDTGILETEKKTRKTERESNERREQLCGLSRNAKQEIEDMKRGASCDGIVKAVEAHEGVHWASCRRLGYVAFRDMHGADRAQEEVDAYGAQIAVLRAEIARVLNLKDCKRYRATGMYTGVVCSLEKPFTLTMSQVSGFQGHPQFTPSNSQGGSLIDNPVIGGLQWEDSGTYTVEEMSWGPDIVMRGNRCRDFPRPTGRLCTPYTNLRIALLPLDTNECDKP